MRDANGKIKELYKTTGVPETFIIDQNGVIAEKVWGPKDWADPSSITTIVDLLKMALKLGSATRRVKRAGNLSPLKAWEDARNNGRP